MIHELLLYDEKKPLKLSPSPAGWLEFLLGLGMGFLVGNATARAILMRVAGITAEEIKRRIKEKKLK